ncbi:MAG: hypothetical protein U0U66_07940 [Cytophagaceae bacterium]
MKKITLILFPVLLAFLCVTVFAQGPIDPPCENEDPSECPDAPFDGGASLLIAGGAGLLGWTAFKKKKKND